MAPLATSDSMPAQHAIIVGSGLAGLSVASRLVSQRIPVILLERSPKPGGNSIKASSGINGAPTKYQPTQEASHENFYGDTIRSAGKQMDSLTAHRETLIRTLTSNSSDAITWLVEQGVDLSKVACLGGHSAARTHRGAGSSPPGYSIISTLLKSLQANDLFDLRTSSTVTKVIHSTSGVSGVEYTRIDGTKHQLQGPVIFASGGFAGDATGLLAKYRPDLAGYPSTNDPRPGTQPLLTTIGAQEIDMDQVQVHPTGFIDPTSPDSRLKFLAAEVLRGEGGILLRDGKRFVNELDTREKVTNAITAIPSRKDDVKQWDIQLVLDEGTYIAAKAHVDFYIFKGLMRKVAIADLGPDALASLKGYASIVSGKTNDSFGRNAFANWCLSNPKPESVVYVGSVTPVIHFTMGGVLINDKSQVLTGSNEPIQGLWAAGEITGGVHGANRLGGSSLLECVVFGRIAGNQVAQYLKASKP